MFRQPSNGMAAIWAKKIVIGMRYFGFTLRFGVAFNNAPNQVQGGCDVKGIGCAHGNVVKPFQNLQYFFERCYCFAFCGCANMLITLFLMQPHKAGAAFTYQLHCRPAAPFLAKPPHRSKAFCPRACAVPPKQMLLSLSSPVLKLRTFW
jgi:hypothetical protein